MEPKAGCAGSKLLFVAASDRAFADVQKVPFLIERDVGATVFALLPASEKASYANDCDHLDAAPMLLWTIASLREARIDVAWLGRKPLPRSWRDDFGERRAISTIGISSIVCRDARHPKSKTAACGRPP